MTSIPFEAGQGHDPRADKPKLDAPKGIGALAFFAGIMTAGLAYMAFS